MFQSDVTGHRMVKYQVHDPESMPQKGHYRRGGPQEAAGEVVRAERGLFQWEQTGTSVLNQNTKASHLDFQYYLQLIVYESTKMHGQY